MNITFLALILALCTTFLAGCFFIYKAFKKGYQKGYHEGYDDGIQFYMLPTKFQIK